MSTNNIQYVPISDQHPLSYPTEDTKLIDTYDEELFLQQRDKDIKGIAHQVTEIKETFIDVKRLVDAETDMIDTIEGNITVTDRNVTESNSELTKAKAEQGKALNKCCLITTVLLFAVAIGCIILIFYLSKTE